MSVITRTIQLALAVSGVSVAIGAWGQSTGTPQPQASAEQSSRTRGSRRADIEEVVVTAQKRQERLQDVPISVSVIGEKSLESGPVRSLDSVLQSTPGFAGYQNAQGGVSRYSVRGVSSNTSLFNSASVVAFYLDDTPFAFVRFPVVPDASAYDVQRVEALRGPQGTLYGASSLNGVIRVITNDADLDDLKFKSRARFASTEDGAESYGVDGALSVPIIPGKLAARMVAGYADEGGWVDYPNASVNDANDSQTKNFRLKVNAAPTDALGVELMTWHSKVDRGASNASRDDRTSADTFAPPFETEFDAHAVTITYDFGPVVLTSATTAMKWNSAGLADAGPSVLKTEMEADLFAEEIRLTSSGDGLWRWSLGGLYRDEADENRQELFPEATFVNVDSDTHNEFKSRSYALFGELTRRFLDGKFETTVGARYFEDENTSNLISCCFGGPPQVPYGKSQPVKSDQWTSRLVFAYHPAQDMTIFAGFSQGFRAGFAQQGLAILAAGGEQNAPPVKPDKLNNYEIGIKGSASDGRIIYDLSAYYIDWSDTVQVVGYPIPGVNNTSIVVFIPINTASADGIGFDAAVGLDLSDRWRLDATVSWNDVAFADDVISGTSILYTKGSRTPESAETTASGHLGYRLPLSDRYAIELEGGVNYTSKLLTQTSVGPVSGDDLLRANAAITVTSSNGWSAMLFGDNLTDEDGRIRPAPLGPGFGSDRFRPRTYGLQLDYRF